MLTVIAVLIFSLNGAYCADETGYAKKRHQLAKSIAREVHATALYHGLQGLDERVLAAMNKVPRHLFIPDSHRREAYLNRPVPIGYGQTISQPYIVALMTALLKAEPHHRVLEVGTGSGYQAAILAELVEQIYSMEIIEPLGQRATRTLKENGYDKVHVRLGDGYYGWSEHAPYDLIIVTAAAGHIPPPLLKQLKPGGRMIIPVGSRFMTQHLVLVMKDRQGGLTTREILPVRFVPLTGGH